MMAESKPEIPIANLYYLLAWAWNCFQEGEELDVDAMACPDSTNLLACVLATGIRRVAAQGLDREYLPVTEETPRLRGRILVAESYRRFTNRSGRMICEFDELSTDTLANQVLRMTCDRLLRSDALTPQTRKQVRHAQGALGEITPIRMTRRSFERVQLHRNNRAYQLLLHICRLLFDLFLPEETTGGHRFRDILNDEIRMPKLFEDFVFNFARHHCRGAIISSDRMKWVGAWDDDVDEVLPTMVTDVTISFPHRKTILDCKFYREALTTRHGRRRLHSTNLYQLNAYLQNKAHKRGWENVDGVLLYPAVNHHLDLSFELLGHAVRICSIDLDKPWQEIEARLCSILAANAV